ncbi:MAG: GMC family oxidoreductase [Luteitalea sp.]|nr:GMC family oxidoreductase [Luteitalea sp.]
MSTRNHYDAIVVGSGISGGWAAKELTEKGLKTLVLERCRNQEHGDYPTEHQPSWAFPLRERKLTPAQAPDHPTQAHTPSFREATKHFYLKDAENPYVQRKPFLWVQGNQVGGRSLMWGRQCYRWSDLDFEANLNDGHGVDWPIRYADIAPWYSYVEKFVGISGERLGLPHLPDGEFQPPMELNAGEKWVRARLAQAYPDRTLTIGRTAVLTQAIGDRLPCHYCGPCFRGCSTGSYFSSQASTLPAARKTGNLALRPYSLVHSVIYDEQRDRATGVRVVDTETGKTYELYAGVIFLCASTLATARVLLNSKSRRHPNGLGGSSGALGRYLMDHHLRLGASGEIPGLLDRFYQGNRPNGAYLPRFRNLEGPDSDRLRFGRGYGYQGGADRAGWSRGSERPEIGAELKRVLRDPGPWHVSLSGFGECLPREDNYVELAEETDPWGIPVLRIHASWGENELAMREDITIQAAEMLEAVGCRNVRTHDRLEEDVMTAMPGAAIHEMGTARMGRDAKTSVLNGHNQVWEAPNVFVTDGACMTSSSCVNPSITYMALTARAVDHAVNELKRKNL